ncbi:MAG: Hint domain-containing protein [Pseudomonadota bacterium]
MAIVIITNANAGDVEATDGDVYIIDPSLSDDVTFTNSGGADISFEVRFDESNPNDLTIEFDDPGMNPVFEIASDVNISDVELDASDAASSTVNVGDNVDLGLYQGSEDGGDTITAGDDFDLDGNLDLGDGTNSFTAGDDFNADGSRINVFGGTGEDTFVIGANGEVNNIDVRGGDDTVTLGDDSEFNNIRTRGGNDEVTLGDGVEGNNIRLDGGADTLNVGVLEEDALNDVRGGGGSDTLNTFTDPDVVEFADDLRQFEIINVVCFVRGTVIATPHGLVPIENLSAGDQVMTMDHGSQPVRWIGSSRVTRHNLVAKPELRPVRIRKGSLGNNLPETDLLVSRQHRVMVRSVIAKRMFEKDELLIPANKLLPLVGIDIEADATEVEYFHMLFERHEIVWSNGAPTESLFTGPEAMKTVSPDAKREILRLFPGITSPDFRPQPARYIPGKGKQMKKLVDRHQKNEKPLFVPHLT